MIDRKSKIFFILAILAILQLGCGLYITTSTPAAENTNQNTTTSPRPAEFVLAVGSFPDYNTGGGRYYHEFGSSLEVYEKLKEFGFQDNDLIVVAHSDTLRINNVNPSDIGKAQVKVSDIPKLAPDLMVTNVYKPDNLPTWNP